MSVNHSSDAFKCCPPQFLNLNTAERRLSETSIIRNVNHPKRQISEPTFSSFYVQTTKKSAITSRNKVLCHFNYVLYFVCTVLHCNGNIILEKPLDFMHCVASGFGYPNYRWSQLLRIIDVLLYLYT